MGKMIADWDAQLNIYRMNYSQARKEGDPDDAIHYATLMWSSMPKEIRIKTPLSQLNLDNSLRCKLDMPSIKWAWCRKNMPKIESALSDHREHLLKTYKE